MTDLMMLRTFQREVAKQCRYALISIDLLNQANSQRASQRIFDQAPTWYAVQGFLIAAGNISKLLWGTKGGGAAKLQVRIKQRRELRSSLGISENSILKLSPDFRNHFEHLDERVEDWADESTHHNMVDDLIGPTTAIGGIDPRDFFRSYNPSTHRLCFRGESFEIAPLVHAIDALLPIAETESSKPHWQSATNASQSA